MAKINIEHERLIEQLTLDSSFEESFMVPYWDGVEYILRHKWRNPHGGYDKTYRNKEGKLHRLYGPAYINRDYNVEMWYKDGVLHRGDGGPAVIHNDNRYWYVDGLRHREDGPAIDSKGQSKQYWLNGQRLSPKEYKKEMARRSRKGHYGRRKLSIEGD